MATSDKLAYLNETKQAIEAALIERGQTVADTDTFRSYADNVLAIQSGGVDVELFDDLELGVDFADGDMKFKAPEGLAITGATILKPATLLPENIAEGVTIAGITGTHKGGGGGTGGGDIATEAALPFTTTANCRFFEYNNALYVNIKSTTKISTNYYMQKTYKLVGDAFEYVCDFIGGYTNSSNANDFHYAEYNGKVYAVGGHKTVDVSCYVFDGTSWVAGIATPNVGNGSDGGLGVYGGELCWISSNDGKMYKYTETAWVDSGVSFSSYSSYGYRIENDIIYGFGNSASLTYSNGSITTIASGVSSPKNIFKIDGVYYASKGTAGSSVYAFVDNVWTALDKKDLFTCLAVFAWQGRIHYAGISGASGIHQSMSV